MRTKRRWMIWVLEEVETFDTPMPWERGYFRKGWKKPAARRKTPLLAARA